MSKLQISVDGDKDASLIYLRGLLNIETSPDLRIHLLAKLRDNNPPAAIVIDLGAVSYIDTSGLATLIEALKMARIRCIAMHLHGLQGRLLQLFQVTGIGALFDTCFPENKLSPVAS